MNIKEIVARLTKHSMSDGVWAEIKLLLTHIKDLEAENGRLREFVKMIGGEKAAGFSKDK